MVPLVVGTVRQQDDERAHARAPLGLVLPAFLEARDGDRQGIADRRSVLDHADVQASRLLAQPVMVERQRREGIRLAGKHDDTDTIVGAVVDESGNHGSHRLQSIDHRIAALEVLGEHAVRQVDADHEVIAATDRVFFRNLRLRAGQSDDQHRDADIGAGCRPQARGSGARNMPLIGRRNDEGSDTTSVTYPRGPGQRQQQQQPPGVAEQGFQQAHRATVALATRWK
ncbi:MAG: hypothetical protein WDO56_32825 [Gammaproteobacteria bacterium]